MKRIDTFSLLLSGKSMARIAMIKALASRPVSGKVIDVGGGRSPDYLPYLDTKDATNIEPVDGRISDIDFEKDSLPYAEHSVDSVILCNTLEHVYNHQFLITECARVLVPGGTLVGFVPFLVAYHPDPNDYFRYTRTALERILAESFTDIKIVEAGGGPFLVNLNTMLHLFPRLLRPIVYFIYTGFDMLYLSLRPSARKRYPLGYAFFARRP